MSTLFKTGGHPLHGLCSNVLFHFYFFQARFLYQLQQSTNRLHFTFTCVDMQTTTDQQLVNHLQREKELLVCAFSEQSNQLQLLVCNFLKLWFPVQCILDVKCQTSTAVSSFHQSSQECQRELPDVFFVLLAQFFTVCLCVRA